MSPERLVKPFTSVFRTDWIGAEFSAEHARSVRRRREDAAGSDVVVHDCGFRPTVCHILPAFPLSGQLFTLSRTREVFIAPLNCIPSNNLNNQIPSIIIRDESGISLKGPDYLLGHLWKKQLPENPKRIRTTKWYLKFFENGRACFQKETMAPLGPRPLDNQSLRPNIQSHKTNIVSLVVQYFAFIHPFSSCKPIVEIRFDWNKCAQPLVKKMNRKGETCSGDRRYLIEYRIME